MRERERYIYIERALDRMSPSNSPLQSSGNPAEEEVERL